MGLDVPVNEVSVPKEFQCTRQLLEEMPRHHLIQRAARVIGIFRDHILGISMGPKSVSTLDEKRQVPERTVLHDQMNVRCGLMTVNQRNDMRMVKTFQNVNLG